MTLKIDKFLDGSRMTFRLTGRMREEQLDGLKTLLLDAGPTTALNLKDVKLVGAEVVRFLANCEEAGTELVDCPPYIRNWIDRELGRT
jgi:hypothetical protein